MHSTRTRRGLAGGIVTLLLGGLLTLIGVSPAAASHGDLTLEVYREFSSTSGNSITLTARVQNADGSPAILGVEANAIEIDWEIQGVSVDGEAGANTPATPDRSCRDTSTPNIGAPYYECSITITSGGALGTGLVRAWIDHDLNGGVIEADLLEGRLSSVDSDCETERPAPRGTHPETRNSDAFDACQRGTEEPGDPAKSEPDDTDVVQISFVGESPVPRLDCPESTPAPAGAGEVGVVACRVTDASGRPLAGYWVDGERYGADPKEAPADFNGDNAAATECRTGGDGICLVRVPAVNANTGDFEICFWIDTDHGADNDGLILGNPSFGTDAGDGGQCATELPAGVPDTPEASTNITDRAHVNRQLRAVTSVNLEPESATRTTGAAHTLTARVLDQFGAESKTATDVFLEFLAGSVQDTDGSTPATPDRSACRTSGTGDNPGTCTFPAYSSSSPGTDTICGFIGTPSASSCNGEVQNNDSVDTVDIVVVRWVAAAATTTTTTAAPGGGSGSSAAQGYSLVGEDGSLYAYGTAKNVGDMKGKPLNAPIIGVAYTPGGNGYWLVAKDGGIFSFGDADFYGSMGGKPLNSDVIGMAATPTGKGYWLFAGDGGIFSFGDAESKFYGSMGDQKLNAPVINMEPIASGRGYWLVAADGGIFSFGEADFYGSMGGKPLNQPVFDMTSSDTDKGYWLVARDGGVFSFGDAEAKFYGSGADQNPRPARVIGMDSTPGSLGYWIADATGKVYAFGNAQSLGDRAGANNPAPMIAFASVPGPKS